MFDFHVDKQFRLQTFNGRRSIKIVVPSSITEPIVFIVLYMGVIYIDLLSLSSFESRRPTESRPDSV